jgi:hypothetical protein
MSYTDSGLIDTGKLVDKFIFEELEFPARRAAAVLSLRRKYMAPTW